MITVVLGALWALWPLVALAGGLAYSVLSGVAALALLPTIVRSLRPRLYFAVLLAFFIYAAISATWSPRDQVLVSFDFDRLQFAVRSEMLRVGLQILAQGILLAAALRLNEDAKRRVQAIAHIGLGIQFLLLIVLTAFENQILSLLTAYIPDTGEGVQNISRNCLIMAAAAPLLAVGLARGRSVVQSRVFVILLLTGVVTILAIRGVHAGLLAIVAALAAMATVHFLPRYGFKALGVLIAIAITSAPWIFDLVSGGASFATANDSASYRAAIWQRVIELIHERPLTGHGLGFLRTVRETIDAGTFAGQLAVPNHSHNMMLQLWAETGAIGAGLLSLAIVLAAWRIPDGRKLGAAALRGAAVVGAMTAVAAVSFDLWNEWWWAVGGLLTTLAVSTPTTAASADEKLVAPAGITFGGAENFAPRVEPVRSSAVISANASHTENNFNLLRLLFAIMVVVFHAIVLPGLPNWQSQEGWSSVGAELGVQGFFVLSGYLVWASLERSASLRLYAEKRVRRLLPGYVAVVLVCVVIAMIVVPATREDVAAVARYLGWNLAFLNFMEPALPGVFESNRFTEINGALWTLKIEVMFYLVLPLLAVFLRIAGRFRWVLFALIYVAAETWRMVLEQGAGTSVELSRQLPGQMSFFITGIALCAWRNDLNWRSMLPPIGLVLLVLSIAVPQAEMVRAAGLGIVSVWLAVGIPKMLDAARFGDLSYGLYIVHFPIIQCVVAAGLFQTSPALAIAIVGLASIVAALLLWWTIERPALRADSAYRRAENPRVVAA